MDGGRSTLIFILSKLLLLSLPGVKRKLFKQKSVLLRYLLPLLSFSMWTVGRTGDGSLERGRLQR